MTFTVPLSGELIEHGHRLMQRVYYEDTDFSGLVYHARYLHFWSVAVPTICGVSDVSKARC